MVEIALTEDARLGKEKLKSGKFFNVFYLAFHFQLPPLNVCIGFVNEIGVTVNIIVE